MFHDLINVLSQARSLFVLTGAGISAESGLPTFRGAGGLWNSYRVEELASPEGFRRDPHTVWSWYNERIAVHRRAQPNAGHLALVEMEHLIPQVIVATQNVDSLHVRAGSSYVLELHGHLREARCTGCGATTSLARGLDRDAIDHVCGGRFRPQVVWFGEPLPMDVWRNAAAASLIADVILVVGTSAQVYPAASLAMQNDRAFVAEINPDATPLSERCNCVIRSGAADALPGIVAALRARR
jgi:NAD-dependent deacetylase